VATRVDEEEATVDASILDISLASSSELFSEVGTVLVLGEHEVCDTLGCFQRHTLMYLMMGSQLSLGEMVPCALWGKD
jgi:hypothetical protein